MCSVAARREFHGWDHDELARRGITFTLFEMPRLAGWVRVVLDDAGPAPDAGAQAPLSQPVPS
jgi:hypothetical protein